MATWPSVQETTTSLSSDEYILEQSGIARVQKRNVLAESLKNSEWSGTVEYLQGVETRGSDGVSYTSVQVTGPTTTVQDPTADVDNSHWVLTSSVMTNPTWLQRGSYVINQTVVGGDNLEYVAVQASGPDTVSVDPTTDTDNSHWKPTSSLQQVTSVGSNNVFMRPSSSLLNYGGVDYAAFPSPSGTTYPVGDVGKQFTKNWFVGTSGQTITMTVSGLSWTGDIQFKTQLDLDTDLDADNGQNLFLTVYNASSGVWDSMRITELSGVTVNINGPKLLTVTLNESVITELGASRFKVIAITESAGYVPELSGTQVNADDALPDTQIITVNSGTPVGVSERFVFDIAATLGAGWDRNNISVTAEVSIAGEWGDPGMVAYQGVLASIYGDTSIVVQTGRDFICQGGEVSGSGHSSTQVSSAPCRVIVKRNR